MTSLCIKGSPLKTQSNENEASRERARRIVGLRRGEMSGGSEERECDRWAIRKEVWGGEEWNKKGITWRNLCINIPIHQNSIFSHTLWTNNLSCSHVINHSGAAGKLQHDNTVVTTKTYTCSPKPFTSNYLICDMSSSCQWNK